MSDDEQDDDQVEDPFEIAIDIISIAIEDGSDVVDLSDIDLDVIPRTLFDHPKIKHLILRNNKFTKIDDRIFEISTIEELDLSYNGISEISNNITKLGRLAEIDLSANELSDVPIILGSIQSLDTVYLNNNALPDWFNEIVNTKTAEYVASYLKNLWARESAENPGLDLPYIPRQVEAPVVVDISNEIDGPTFNLSEKSSDDKLDELGNVLSQVLYAAQDAMSLIGHNHAIRDDVERYVRACEGKNTISDSVAISLGCIGSVIKTKSQKYYESDQDLFTPEQRGSIDSFLILHELLMHNSDAWMRLNGARLLPEHQKASDKQRSEIRSFAELLQDKSEIVDDRIPDRMLATLPPSIGEQIEGTAHARAYLAATRSISNFCAAVGRFIVDVAVKIREKSVESTANGVIFLASIGVLGVTAPLLSSLAVTFPETLGWVSGLLKFILNLKT